MESYINLETNDISTTLVFCTSVKMNRVSLYLFTVLIVVYIGNIQALECGIDKGPNQRELRQVAENCMQKKTEKTDKPISEDSDDDDESPEGNTTESYKSMKRNKRNDNNTDNNHQMTEKTMNNNMNNNGTSESDSDNNCVVHCVFRQMGMLDNNGFPEHNRVSQALLRNANGRELRDFIQDTTDECFELMDQGERQDPCLYSVTLVNCLAERGKSNCADWPVGNLSFLSKN